MDGGKDQGAGGVRRPLLHQRPQFFQPGQQPGRGGFRFPQRFQDIRLAAVHAPLFPIGPVAHLLHHPAHRRVRPVPRQAGQMTFQLTAPFAGPGGSLRVSRQVSQRILPRLLRPGRGLLGQSLGDARPQLIIQGQEQRAVSGSLRKAQQIGDIPHHPMGKEQALHLAAAVGYPRPGQPVDQRQGAVVVPVEHSGLPGAVCRQVAEKLVLLVPVPHRYGLHRRAGSPYRAHVFGAAVLIFLDKRIRRRHDRRGGTVVLLQIEDAGGGIVFLKMGERPRAGGPESVDALVLVPHQEQVAVFPGQHPQDRVLDLGCILGLVHTEPAPAAPQPGQQVGAAAQNLQRIDHLIVVVHEPPLPHGAAVSPVERRKVAALHLYLTQFFVGEHLIFGVGNGGGQPLDGALTGKLALLRPEQLGQQRVFAPLLQQGESCAAVLLLIEADDPAAHPIDGAEGQPRRFRLTKKSGVPPAHIRRCRHRVGHGQDFPGGHAPPMKQIAQPGHQDGGLAAAGHRQQQHRALHRLYRRLLLGVQLQGIVGFELGKLHGAPRPVNAIRTSPIIPPFAAARTGQKAPRAATGTERGAQV